MRYQRSFADFFFCCQNPWIEVSKEMILDSFWCRVKVKVMAHFPAALLLKSSCGCWLLEMLEKMFALGCQTLSQLSFWGSLLSPLLG